MKAWDKIRESFNRATGRDIAVRLEDLARIVTPVHPAAQYDASPKVVAKGLSELNEWIRIGWDAEKNKGPSFEAFYVVMRQLDAVVSLARDDAHGNPAREVVLPREHLQVLRATYTGVIEEARIGLEAIAKYQKKMPTPRMNIDEHGQLSSAPLRPEDFVGVIQIYNRPHADHALQARKLDECRQRLDSFFVQGTVRPANGERLVQTAARYQLFR